jgi:hypothetical protein
LYNTLQPQLNSSPLHPEKNNAVSPLVENGFSSLVENRGMNGGKDKNLLRLPATMRGNEIDDSFKQYLLAQRKRNLKQILLKAAKHGHILQTGDAYIAGSFGLTMVGNVPLNQRLAKFDASKASGNEIAQARAGFEKPWNRLHTIRTIASIAATVLIFAACFSP